MSGLHLVGRGLAALVVAGTAFASAAAADSDQAEREFKDLQERYARQQERYEAALAEAANSPQEHDRIVEQLWPGNTLAGEFLQLEAKHRGSRAGLWALHHLVSLGGSFGDPDAPVTKARAAACLVLRDHYAEHPDLDVLCWWLALGSRPPESRDLLRRAMESPHRHVRGVATLTLAELLQTEALVVPRLDAALELKGDDVFSQAYAKARADYGVVDVAASRREALALLEQVTSEYGDVLEAPRTPYGPIQVNAERGQTDSLTRMPRRSLAERARSMQFELLHLAIGQPAPEISGKDASGAERKLSAERGKAVVLMFSFKGCGPCEAMYPDNRKLVENYHGRPFAFLGVMGDDEMATVTAAVQQGIITWPVWWDGSRGPIAQHWNVNSWPQIYVLDHQGVIRYRGLRGELLALAVARLVKEAEAAAAVTP